MQKIYTIIPAGGSGTRLWPLSRTLYPKQFIKLEELDGFSLFQKTFLRAEKISGKDNIIIVTNKEYKFHCVAQINELGINIDDSQILLEPQAKNTLGAIVFGMKNIREDDAVGLILWSDQIIEDEDSFKDLILSNLNTAKKHILIFGIKPRSPHTGYEYISMTKGNKFPIKIDKFITRPATPEIGKQYIKKGYLWNAGIFMFSKKLFFEELEKGNKHYFEIFEKEKNLDVFFKKIPDISIDLGLIQLSNNVYVNPIYNYWTDLGSFDALDEYVKYKNYKNTNILEVDSKNNTIFSEIKDKKVVLIGMNNCIIVDTKDALLISNKGETYKNRDVVKLLKEDKSYLTDFGMTVYRPWGSYTILEKGDSYKTKRLSVLSGKRLSLQMHHHRSEHWTVVSGTATVTIDDEEKIIGKGESTFIPIGAKHRLANNGKVELHIIESQIGDYLEEDDTVSFADDYGRGQKRIGS